MVLALFIKRSFSNQLCKVFTIRKDYKAKQVILSYKVQYLDKTNYLVIEIKYQYDVR